MLKNVETVLEKPILYKKTEGEFWNDEHISMQMLKAHLNPKFTLRFFVKDWFF